MVGTTVDVGDDVVDDVVEGVVDDAGDDEVADVDVDVDVVVAVDVDVDDELHAASSETASAAAESSRRCTAGIITPDISSRVANYDPVVFVDAPEADALVEILTIAEHALPISVIRQLLPPELWRADLVDDAARAQLVDIDAAGTVRLTVADGRATHASIGFVRSAQVRAALGRAMTNLEVVPAHVVSRHRLAGLVVDADPTVIPDALMIARRLVRTGDLDAAIELYRNVLAALDRGAEPSTARVATLGGLAAALSWANRPDEGAELLDHARATAVRSGDALQLAAAALAWSGRAIAIDDDPTNTAFVDRALDALAAHRATLPAEEATSPELDAVHAQLLGLRADRLVFDDLAASQTISREALRIARRSGEPDTIVRAAYTRRVAIWHPSTHAETMELAGEMVALSPLVADHPEFGTVTRLQVFLERGDFAHFDAELRAMGRRIEREHGAFERVWLETFRAARALVRGEWAAVTGHVASARALASGFDYEILEQLLLGQEMLVAWHTGTDLSSLVTSDALPAGPMRDSWSASLLGLSADQLAPAEVDRRLAWFLAGGAEGIRRDLTWGPVTSCLSMAAAATGNATHAQVLTDAIGPFADQWAATGGAVNFGPFAWHLGRLASVLGDADAARRHLDDALHRCTEAESEPWLAHVHLAIAALDRERAPHHASLAAEIADRLRMPGVASAASRVLESPATAVRPAGLTIREAEVLTLVADGLTNKAISERLYLSVKTVERHLLNGYVKLGVRNRSEATAYVIRNGLGG